MIGKQIYWVHDFDAYENNPLEAPVMGLEGVEIGFTDYGRLTRWNNGNSKDIFRKVKDEIYKRSLIYKHEDDTADYYHFSEELILTDLIDKNTDNVNARLKRLNISYNFNMRKIVDNYAKAEKPIKVLHFHPYNKLINTLAIAMYGKNRIHMPLMTERLIKIFNYHGIQ